MASVKLKHTLGNGTILHSPAANPSSDVTLKLPSTTGTAGQVLKVASANHSSTNAELEFGAAGASGKILQVVSTTKTDHFSMASDTSTEITGLNVSITPSASTSKIYLMVNVGFGTAANTYVAFNLKRDSTLICVTTAVSGDSRRQSTASGHVNGTSFTENAAFNFLDTPNTTSAISYKVFTSSLYASRSININRTNATSDELYNQGVTSTITAMEVAA